MITTELKDKILKIYEEAWVEQDTNKILSIFNKDGIYHERTFHDAFIGHDQIKKHWDSKVCQEQSNITFELLNSYADQDTIIAEWEASFDSNIENTRITIKEVAIMEIKNDKIQHYREYWHSKKVPL